MTIPPRLAAALGDRYRIERPLGEGAAAVVYLAADLKHGRRVAVKVLKPEVAASLGGRRFLDEIQTTAALRHPHVLPLFDSGEADGFSWFVTPWVEGESLKDRLARERRLGLDEALAIARDVGSALAYAHDRGIVHRDIKPANVLLGEGGALVADFGVALALSGAGGASAADARDEVRLTATGMVVGTPVYMSPEQVGEGPVDGRSDLFALGCLTYEMLSGVSPFESDTVAGVVAKIVAAEPVPLRRLRPEVPGAVERVVSRALAKDPDDRFPTVGAFLEALAEATPRAGSGGAGPAGRRRPGTLAAAGVVLAAVAVAGVFGWRGLQRAEARSSLLEIERLVDEGRWVEAYDRAVEAERWIPGDTLLERALAESGDLLTVTSEPPGARVTVKRFVPGANAPPDPLELGVTPLRDVRLPRADHLLRVELDGRAPLERIVSSGLVREMAVGEAARRVEVNAPLRPRADVPDDMVPVPGGRYELMSPDAPLGIAADLEPFLIDRTEVTNEAYASFVAAGGYDDPSWWSDGPPGATDGYVDRTGLPGPREWSRQRPAAGSERLPVAGVSWAEAAAFCRWAGKRLPTIFEWEKTARGGGMSSSGVLMPWGRIGSDAPGVGRANFSSSGPVPVDTYPFGMSPYGAYGMAGNVREWLFNASGGGRVAAGSSWRGPVYVYSEYTVEDPGDASDALGFRCARTFDDASGSVPPGGEAVEIEAPPPAYTPVDEATFAGLLSHYRYDPRPANPRGATREETPDWVRERLWIDGVEGDSILVYVWTPRSSAPPFQTLLYVGSSSAFSVQTIAEQAEFVVGPLIQGGRAVVAPAVWGMVERPTPRGATVPDPPSVGFRDLMVRHATELRLALDYALARPDLDDEALAYVGLSWGAGSRLGFAAVDDRFRAVVFIGGGIDERVKPTLPEADNVNFAPRIRAPTLLVNGDRDEEHPWETRALPLWNLLTEPKELRLVPGAGHNPPAEALVPAVDDFLDRTLGPVGRR